MARGNMRPLGSTDVQVTFLGTSSGVPTRGRNVSSVAVRLPQRAELWLFDCGEGTQHQFLRSDLRVSQLRRIFITHMHGDHVFGLPGLLASLGLAGRCPGVDLYGPDPLRDYLEGVLRTSSTRIGYPLRSHRVRQAAHSGDVLLDDGDLSVRCTPLNHRIPAYAYRIDQKPLPGRFDVNLAKELGIPPETPYFNAGVLIMDLEAWRRENFAKRCMDYAEKYPELCIFWDQTVMNTLLAGRFTHLDQKWNQQFNGLKKSSDDLGILHFWGSDKPWNFTNDLPHGAKNLFFEELDRTAWLGWRPQPQICFGERVVRKIKKTVYGF